MDVAIASQTSSYSSDQPSQSSHTVVDPSELVTAMDIEVSQDGIHD